ncbi:MAG: hypothetical protein K1X85_05455 [Ignavibacteria bacterium]|nr:hypothetical protein [Ignavibacteria bacterium]
MAKLNKSVPKSNVFALFRTFSAEEWKGFTRFLKNSQSSSNPAIASLFSAVSLHYPGFEGPELQPKIIFEKAFPGRRFDDVLYRKYMSTLFRIAEEFLCMKKTDVDEIRSGIRLLEEYQKRDLNGLFNKKAREIESALNSKVFHRNDVNLLHHELCVMKYYFLHNENRIIESYEELDKSGWYLLNTFISFAATVNNMFSSMNYNLAFDDSYRFPAVFFRNFDFGNYLKEIEGSEFEFSELERLNHELINLDFEVSSAPGESLHYQKLKLTLENSSQLIPGYKLLYYYKRLILYCLKMRRLGRDDTDYNIEIFGHYKLLIDKDLVFAGDDLTVNFNDLQILIDSALKSGNCEWVSDFLDKCEANFEGKPSHNMIKLGRARILYESNETAKCLEILASLKPVSDVMGFELYAYKFFCLYDLNHMSSAMNLLDTFRHHASYNRNISPRFAESHKRFINYSKKLLNQKKKPSLSKLNRLYDEITGDYEVSKRMWLLGKVSNLLEQNS